MSRRLILRIAAWCVLAAAVYFFLYVYPARVRPTPHPGIFLAQFDLDTPADRLTALHSDLASLPASSVLVSDLQFSSEEPLRNIQDLLHVNGPCTGESSPDSLSFLAHLHRCGYRTEAFLHDPTGIALVALASCFHGTELFLGESTSAESVFEQAIDRFRSRERDRQPLLLYVRLHPSVAASEALSSTAARLVAFSQEHPQDVVALVATAPTAGTPRRHLSALILAPGRIPVAAPLHQQSVSIQDIHSVLLTVADLPPMPEGSRDLFEELLPSPFTPNDRP